jgi:LacI family transcriptional regulator
MALDKTAGPRHMKGMSAPRRPAAAPASLASVAAEAGVSMSTVSRIVNGETGRASAETVERVRRAIAAVGYRPNHLGRALRRGETQVVAMLSANLDNPVMATIAASTETALREAGYVMILCDTHDRPDLQDEYLHAMRAQAVQGYVLVASVPSPGLDAFMAEGAPIVFVGRPSATGAGAFVGIDNRQAGADAADYLWSRGVTEPAVLYPTQGSSTTRERVAGFCARMAALGAPASRIIEAEAPGLSHLDVGYRAACSLVARRGWPRGMMCVSDQLAYGVYRLAHETGKRIDDCIVVSIDGSALNAWLAPWLVSVGTPFHEFGPRIVERLVELWAGKPPTRCILPHRLTV